MDLFWLCSIFAHTWQGPNVHLLPSNIDMVLQLPEELKYRGLLKARSRIIGYFSILCLAHTLPNPLAKCNLPVLL